MAITLRTTKGSPLTYSELDGNFSDLDQRINAIETANVISVNGSTGVVSLTSADIPENTNLYFTNARVDARIAATTSDNIDEGTTNLYFTNARARSALASGTGISYNANTGVISTNLTTTDVVEGTNLYFTNARVDTRLAALSISVLGDVSYAGTPTNNYVLTWNDSAGVWEPAAAPGATGGEANTGSNLGAGQGLFASKVGTDLRFYSLSGSNGVSVSSPSSDIITISNSQDLTTAGSPTFVNANISNLRLTNNSITTATSNGDITITGNGTGKILVNAGNGLLISSGNLTVGNITASGNTIASTDSNGNINLSPNGTGNVFVSSYLTAPVLVSNIATGTAPFVVTSTTQVANLNVAVAGTALTAVTATTATSATTAGTVTTAAQPNITSVGTLSSVITSGPIISNASNANLSLGNVSVGNTPYIDFNSSGNSIDYDARIIATSGNSTVGSGTLSFVAANVNISRLNVGNLTLTASTLSTSVANGDILVSPNGTGKIGINKTPVHLLDVNGTVGAASLSISNSSVLGTSISDGLTINAGLVGSLLPIVSNNGDIGSTLFKFRSAYFGSNLFVDGNITSSLTNGSINIVPAGSGSLLVSSPVTATRFISNIATGTAPLAVTSTTRVANLNVATAGTAETVTTAAQPNITSLGTLSSLASSGTITATRFISNIATGTAPFTVTSTTQVANLNAATSGTSLTAGTVTTAAQPNITSVGTLSSLSVTGAISSSNGAISDSKGDVRTLPTLAKTSAYALANTDIGKVVSITTGGITVNSGIFVPGDAISIYNDSGSSQTITQGTGVTMYLAGSATSGNRTLAQRGISTVLCVASNTFVISGAGLS